MWQADYMIDYGSAYFFNMMPIDVTISLNGGEERLLRGISDSEPFDPSYCSFERSFEVQNNVFARNNTIVYGRSNQKNEASLNVDPRKCSETSPDMVHLGITKDIRIYLFYDLVIMCYDGNGGRVTLLISQIKQDLQASQNRIAYFYNLTDQSVLLILNGDEKNSQILSATSDAEPFTPCYVSFPRTEDDRPKEASFGINNDIQYLLTSSAANDAKRVFSLQITHEAPGDAWPLDKDIQIYLFNDSLLARMGGKTHYCTPIGSSNFSDNIRNQRG